MRKKSYWEIEIRRYLRAVRHNPKALFYRAMCGNEETGLLTYRKDGYVNRTPVNEYQISNSYYGMSSQLKKFGGYSGVVAASIEHGLYFGGANTWEVSRYDLPCVITFGEERRTALRKVTDRPVFTIGPYICYASPWTERDEFRKLKKALGRTLLVFPCHTIESTSVRYEVSEFTNFINEVKEMDGFDSVLVSLYFTDIAKYAHQYEEAGYIVVCSGHRGDPLFMDRQRLYFDLAEATISNSVGTHVGYSIALNKPHCIFEQKIDSQAEQIKSSLHVDQNRKKADEERADIARCFSHLPRLITEEQKKIVNRYWGLPEIKQREEMRLILEIARDVLRDSSSSREDYRTLFLRRIELSNSNQCRMLVESALR